MKTYLFEVQSHYGEDDCLTRESVLVYANNVFEAQEKIRKNYPYAGRLLMKTIE